MSFDAHQRAQNQLPETWSNIKIHDTYFDIRVSSWEVMMQIRCDFTWDTKFVQNVPKSFQTKVLKLLPYVFIFHQQGTVRMYYT